MSAWLLAAAMTVGTVTQTTASATAVTDQAADEEYRQADAAAAEGDPGAAARFDAFRKAHPDHPLAWQAALRWARGATEPQESERRFEALAAEAPPASQAACELELAHLKLVQDRAAKAEEAYAAWLVKWPQDERGEEAAFWQAACQDRLGRRDEAAAAWKRLRDRGRHPGWRGQAGLGLAAAYLERRRAEEARQAARWLLGASWARDVRPQALLLEAKAALAQKRAGEAQRALQALVRDYPALPEAREARELMGGRAPRGPRYGVQVGAYARKAAARAAQKMLEKQGRKAVVEQRTHGGLSLYAVILGPYPERAAAEAERNKLREAGTAAFVVSY